MLPKSHTAIPTFFVTGNCIDFESNEGFYLGDTFGTSTGVAPGGVIFVVDFTSPDKHIIQVPVSYSETSDVQIVRAYRLSFLPPLPRPFQIGQNLNLEGGVIGFDFSGFSMKITHVTFQYLATYSAGIATDGRIFLSVNGQADTFASSLNDWPDPKELGGVDVTLRSQVVHEEIPVPNNSNIEWQSGIVTLTGEIRGFQIGRSEMLIDHICIGFQAQSVMP